MRLNLRGDGGGVNQGLALTSIGDKCSAARLHINGRQPANGIKP